MMSFLAVSRSFGVAGLFVFLAVVNNVQYNGGRFGVHHANYDVIQINGDRVVIGKGKVVTAAVNVINLKKV